MNDGALPVRITCGVGGGSGEVVARAVARVVVRAVVARAVVARAAVAVRGEGGE